jgi:hypothetical protein
LCILWLLLLDYLMYELVNLHDQVFIVRFIVGIKKHLNYVLSCNMYIFIFIEIKIWWVCPLCGCASYTIIYRIVRYKERYLHLFRHNNSRGQHVRHCKEYRESKSEYYFINTIFLKFKIKLVVVSKKKKIN